MVGRGVITGVDGVLWRLQTGAPWRDLPERYGPWQTVWSYTAADDHGVVKIRDGE